MWAWHSPNCQCCSCVIKSGKSYEVQFQSWQSFDSCHKRWKLEKEAAVEEMKGKEMLGYKFLVLDAAAR